MATVTSTFWLKDGLGGDLGEDGVITQEESVILTFDSIVPTVRQAIADSGFFVGQPHRTDQSLVLQPGIDGFIHADDNAHVWQFNLVYSTASFNIQSREESTYTTEVGISKWTYNRTVLTDQKSGDAILLPTGEPYDSAFFEQISAPIISVTVKEYSPHTSRISMIGSINSAAVKIAGVNCPKYCAMLDDYSPKPHRDEDGYLTFRNTFKIKLKFANNKAGNEIGFTIETLAASFNQVVDSKLVAIKVADEEFPDDRTKDVLAATPQMVDANGELTTTPYYQEWVTNSIVNFGQFGLPSSYPAS
jgi:hypothetical protein